MSGAEDHRMARSTVSVAAIWPFSAKPAQCSVGDVGRQPHELRTTNWGDKMSCTGVDGAVPRTRSKRSAKPRRPSAAIGWATVVSGGTAMADGSVLSTLMMARSSGTRSPRS